MFGNEYASASSILTTIRSNLCDENFMFGSPYIKGSIVSALKIMSKLKDKSKPIVCHIGKDEMFDSFS